MKAITYYRVSSAAQQERESIDTQKFEHEAFFKAKGYDLAVAFEDDGISGESIDKRPGFQKTLKRIATGDIDVLVVFAVDRIGRFKHRHDRNRVVELLETTHTNVHVSVDDVVFRWDNEKEINSLEYELNASRQDNVLRGKRIARGHANKRLKGHFSGGVLPFGIRWDPDRKVFYAPPAEVKTLAVIFQKLSSGWGLGRVEEFLNAHLKRHPKKPRLRNGRLVKKWSAVSIRNMVLNDFYFSGIVNRTKKSIEKDIPPMDTGIKLFDKTVVELARREMAVRRIRRIDPARKDRQLLHNQQHKTVFTDALFHGIARCGFCGWKLGIHNVRDGNYRYYVCRGSHKPQKCQFKSVRVEQLDVEAWERFLSTLRDPAQLAQQVLKQNFIIDKELQTKKNEYKKAAADAEKIASVLERLKNQYAWNHLSETEYLEAFNSYTRLLADAQKRADNLKAIIEQPQHVRDAVERATEYVSFQLQALGSEHMAPVSAWGIQAAAEALAGESADTQLLVFQQKRALIQEFIDPDNGLQIKDLDTFEFNFTFNLAFKKIKRGESPVPPSQESS